MNGQTSNLSITVNVANPGVFFACCGLLEVAHRLWCGGEVEGWFDVAGPSWDGQFRLCRHDGQPATVVELVQAAIKCQVDKVSVSDPKTDPIYLHHPISLQLDWWLERDGSKNLLKTWAANATSLQMFTKWREPLLRCLSRIQSKPDSLMSESERVQGSYGFDSELGWDGLSIGFSYNEHGNLKKLPTRPALELFGAIGLQRFFPRIDKQEGVVRYAVWDRPLTAPVARAAMLDLLRFVVRQRFRTRVVERGSFKGLEIASIDEEEESHE